MLEESIHDSDEIKLGEEQLFGVSVYNDREYFTKLLKQFAEEFVIRGPWAVVRKSKRVQGWKLHVSSIPIEASRLLIKVVPFLRDQSVPYKIAKDMRVLSQLNEGDLGPTQVGKFMTIYPESDSMSKNLAESLIKLTLGFNGPVIVSDRRLGDVIYTRYGNYNPIITRDRLGQIFLSIYAPDGSLRRDSYEVPFVCPEGVSDPFSNFPVDKTHIPSVFRDIQPEKRSKKLFGPGYLVLEVVKQNAKGSVFKAIDLRSQELVGTKIIKQGRQHCLSDEYGRDMRTRLQRQENLHLQFREFPTIPRTDPYFEVAGDGYLPIHNIDGQSIESFAVSRLANRSWLNLDVTEQKKLMIYLEQLLLSVQQIHLAGYVHRDLTASNIWIGDDGKVYLLDLELTHQLDDPTPAFGLGTPGFMSPQQEMRMPPALGDDIYALGCSMILLLTGLDPRRVLFANQSRRTQQLLGLTNGAPQNLIEIIAQCVSTEPTERPGTDDILTAVRRVQNFDKTFFISKKQLSSPSTVDFLIESGLKGLMECTIADDHGLWMSAAINNSSHQVISRIASSYELRRSANRGVAGVVYVLSRLRRLGWSSPGVGSRIKNAIKWLMEKEESPDLGLNGLHFGEAGVAVAITEAISAGIIEANDKICSFILKSLSGVVDWPDITHGAAGQGIASLYCFDCLKQPTLLEVAHSCAAYLTETQKEDGSWQIPAGVEGMSGETLTGFAHGTAGIVYFLAEYNYLFKDRKSEIAWKKGAEWLLKEAIESKNGKYTEWIYSDAKPVTWKWWCHGSPGIALTFLRLYEHSQEEQYADIARKGLRIHPTDLRYPNLSQCHGVCGLGEIYLEAARVLSDDEWYERAEWLVFLLSDLRHETQNGCATWLVEDPYLPTADLMVGSGGVLHFLMRFRRREDSIGFPLLRNSLASLHIKNV